MPWLYIYLPPSTLRKVPSGCSASSRYCSPALTCFAYSPSSGIIQPQGGDCAGLETDDEHPLLGGDGVDGFVRVSDFGSVPEGLIGLAEQCQDLGAGFIFEKRRQFLRGRQAFVEALDEFP